MQHNFSPTRSVISMVVGVVWLYSTKPKGCSPEGVGLYVPYGKSARAMFVEEYSMASGGKKRHHLFGSSI